MKNLHNIEKSGFRRGEYVGYANGVYRIRQSTSSHGNWFAYPDRNYDDGRPTAIYAFTLEEMSAKLESLGKSLIA